MCFETYIDEYSLYEELLHSEALRLYRRGDLGGLRELHVKAARMGAGTETLKFIEEMIYELEEKLLERMRRSVVQAVAETS